MITELLSHGGSEALANVPIAAHPRSGDSTRERKAVWENFWSRGESNGVQRR